MKAIGACLLVSMFLSLNAGAQPKAERPLLPVSQLTVPEKPSAGLARLNPMGKLILKFWGVRHERVIATRILRNGKEVEEKVVFYQPVEGWQETLHDLDDVRILRSDGTDVEKKLVGFLLKTEQPVLYVIGDGKIDPAFLKVIKKETLILILSPQRTQLPAPMP
ncbi:MAG: hypothetical protein AB7K24_30620 [Gemmataceae bacterium]